MRDITSASRRRNSDQLQHRLVALLRIQMRISRAALFGYSDVAEIQEPGEMTPRGSGDGPEVESGEAAEAALPFPVVGIGASAGGINALEDFFRHVAPDSGMAYVVVQ